MKITPDQYRDLQHILILLRSEREIRANEIYDKKLRQEIEDIMDRRIRTLEAVILGLKVEDN